MLTMSVLLQAAAAGASGGGSFTFYFSIGLFIVLIILFFGLFRKKKSLKSTEKTNGMAQPIIALIIGAMMFVGGYALKEAAKDQMKFGYTYRPPYANAEEESVAQMNNASEYIKIGGIIVAIAGGLWLVVAAIREKK